MVATSYEDVFFVDRRAAIFIRKVSATNYATASNVVNTSSLLTQLAREYPDTFTLQRCRMEGPRRGFTMILGRCASSKDEPRSCREAKAYEIFFSDNDSSIESRMHV